MQEKAYTSETLLGFLDALQEQIKGNIVLVWDGAPIHRSKLIKAYLAQGAAKRLHLERLPGYAPELNPDEGIWHYLKHVEFKNRACADMNQLQYEIEQATQRLKEKTDIIIACFKQTRYFTYQSVYQ